jgi:hypothetical protein
MLARDDTSSMTVKHITQCVEKSFATMRALGSRNSSLAPYSLLSTGDNSSLAR